MPSRDEIASIVASLGAADLVEIVTTAAERHEDVARSVELVAARTTGDLAGLRAAVDRCLRTRRFIDYRASFEFAHDAEPAVAELATAARAAVSQELVELLERAVGHVVKILIRGCDDSAGVIGGVAQRLLDVHAVACDQADPDPVRIARWIVRFRLRDQDLFEADPVRYADALGERGLAALRQELDRFESADGFGERYLRARLAVVDRDTNAIVAITGGDLRHAGQYLAVAEAMGEIGRPDLVLDWTTRGIAETSGWQTDALYDLACSTHADRDEPLDVLRLRRAHHERNPTSSTYAKLKEAAGAVDTWDRELDAARAALQSRDVRGYVHAVLGDDDDRLAWATAQAAVPGEIDRDLWLRLAERRETTHPDEALAAYLRIADEILVETDRRAYASAIRILKRARSSAKAAGRVDAFSRHIAALRDDHRRRPTFVVLLDKAEIAAPPS